MNRQSLGRVISLLLVLTSCAGVRGEKQVPPRQEPNPASYLHLLQTDWDNPIRGEEVKVANLPQAVEELPFAALTPFGLGVPKKILASPPATEPEFRTLALIYDADPYGRVVVIEHLPPVPVSEYESAHEAWVAQSNDPELESIGNSEIVTIRGTRKALITTSEDYVSDIYWLEGAIEIIIRGPTLDRVQVLEIAELSFIETY